MLGRTKCLKNLDFGDADLESQVKHNFLTKLNGKGEKSCGKHRNAFFGWSWLRFMQVAAYVCRISRARYVRMVFDCVARRVCVFKQWLARLRIQPAFLHTKTATSSGGPLPLPLGVSAFGVQKTGFVLVGSHAFTHRLKSRRLLHLGLNPPGGQPFQS